MGAGPANAATGLSGGPSAAVGADGSQRSGMSCTRAHAAGSRAGAGESLASPSRDDGCLAGGRRPLFGKQVQLLLAPAEGTRGWPGPWLSGSRLGRHSSFYYGPLHDAPPGAFRAQGDRP